MGVPAPLSRGRACGEMGLSNFPEKQQLLEPFVLIVSWVIWTEHSRKTFLRQMVKEIQLKGCCRVGLVNSRPPVHLYSLPGVSVFSDSVSQETRQP